MPVRRKPAAITAPLNPRAICAAALKLIDADGLESLSMRKLGTTLGVEAMALYHHFSNKGELLDGVTDLLLDEAEPALDGDAPPLERLRRGFHAVRNIAITHPRAFWLLAARRFRTPRALAFYEHLLQTFRDAGFDAHHSARFFRLAGGFVIGAGVAEIGSRALNPDATPVVLEDFFDPEHYPRVSEVVPYLRISQLDDIFEYGIETIIQAMQRHLNSNRDGARTPRGRRKRK
jgi:AcrR family transcriptional regulator